VSGIDPGVVGKYAEDPSLQVVHQRREVLLRPRLAWTAREQRVPGEQVCGAVGGTM